jgi:hypothetical protein
MKTKESKVESGVAGGIAGFLATIPMSLCMLAIHRKLPVYHRSSLPPKKLTTRIARKIGISHKLSRKEKRALSVFSHFGYGTGAGSIYGLVSNSIPATPLIKGIGFGLLVWAGSYFGFLPAINLWHTEEEHHKRYWMMAAAHVVWGAFLGLGHEKLEKRPDIRGMRHKKSQPDSFIQPVL